MDDVGEPKLDEISQNESDPAPDVVTGSDPNDDLDFLDFSGSDTEKFSPKPKSISDIPEKEKPSAADVDPMFQESSPDVGDLKNTSEEETPGATDSEPLPLLEFRKCRSLSVINVIVTVDFSV